MSNVCAMVLIMATNRLLRLRFSAVFICCLSVHRAWKDRASGELIHANGERWLTKTQRPKRIALHPDGSRRAVAVARLAAQGRWLCFRVVWRERILRALCGQGPFHYSCAAISRPKLGHGPKNWGYDYLAINRALEEAFARCAIDRSRIAIGGFSDGASYALSLGLANGDVFSYIVACSPGFIVRAQARGRSGPRGVEVPLIYIAHGLSDNVLPIASTSRIFVSSLRKNGYNVEFDEFSGGHHASRQVADQAMSWLITAFHERRPNPRRIDSRHS